jgi:ferritin-like metal-binding protein YciE
VESLEARNEKNVYNLEKAYIVEKCLLKQQMIEKLNELKNELRSSFHKHMNETTRNLIKTNYFLNSNSKKLAEKLEKLITENETLKKIVNSLIL